MDGETLAKQLSIQLVVWFMIARPLVIVNKTYVLAWDNAGRGQNHRAVWRRRTGVTPTRRAASLLPIGTLCPAERSQAPIFVVDQASLVNPEELQLIVAEIAAAEEILEIPEDETAVVQ